MGYRSDNFVSNCHENWVNFSENSADLHKR